MNKIAARFAPAVLLFLLVIGFDSRARAQNLRTLIVSGGPDAATNQYAIESNARYVEKLTNVGTQRVLFADGKRNSRTISTLAKPANERELTVLTWILGEISPAAETVMKAPTLERLDGDSRPKTILREVENLTKNVKSGERGLIYVTGHGSPGRTGGFLGLFSTEDYENTRYNAWGGDLSVQELAPALQKWPEGAPLTLVMVQCHNGGFANLIWQDGDPEKAVRARDFCGFFATTGARLAAGCTSEVNERDYQDFTTHFFAALSGVSRDGRPISGADYDHNGAVSGLEALAYTSLHDDSIDVPLCTSDFYLRQIFNEQSENGGQWLQTSYSAILKEANTWQSAILNGLSRDLNLSGQKRLATAFSMQKNLKNRLNRSMLYGGEMGDDKIDSPQVSGAFYSLEKELLQRFPALKSKKSRSYAAAKTKALAFLKNRPAQVAILYQASAGYDNAANEVETREAKLWRFLRAAHTAILQKRLQERGTSEQKAVFTRLRAAESRNFLKK